MHLYFDLRSVGEDDVDTASVLVQVHSMYDSLERRRQLIQVPREEAERASEEHGPNDFAAQEGVRQAQGPERGRSKPGSHAAQIRYVVILLVYLQSTIAEGQASLRLVRQRKDLREWLCWSDFQLS